MGEIRFVGPGETRGYHYLVCKKYLLLTDVMVHSFTDFMVFFSLYMCKGHETSHIP